MSSTLDLTAAERRVLDAKGALVDLRAGHPDVDDPALGGRWGDDRTVRSGFLRDLLVQAKKPGIDVMLSPLRLRGARITGVLDLEHMEVARPVFLQDCSFAEPVDMRQARALEVRLPGCHLPSLEAVQLEVRGNLILDGVTASSVNLRSASISGGLSLDGAVLHNPDGATLCAGGITVGQHTSCGSGFASTGMVELTGADLCGGLTFTGATLTNAVQWALSAQGMKVSYALFMGSSIGDPGGFIASGGLRLVGARVDGFVCCWGARITGLQLGDETFYAIAGRGLAVSENLMLNRGFAADGEIDLTGARIGEEIDFEGAKLTNLQGRALTAERLVVGGPVLCTNGFTARGEISLPGASIGGSLDLAGSQLESGAGPALDLGGAVINGSILLTSGAAGVRPRIRGRIDMAGARVEGQVLIRDAALEGGGSKPADHVYARDRRAGAAVSAPQLSVGGQVTLEGSCEVAGGLDLSMSKLSGFTLGPDASVSAPARTAVDLTSAQVRSSVVFERGAAVAGTVRLSNATIGGYLSLRGATLSDPEPRANARYDQLLLAAQGATVNGDVDLRDLTASGGRVDFRGTRLGGAVDAARARLDNPSGYTLSLHQAAVNGSVRLNEVVSTGLLVINRATVDGRRSRPVICWSSMSRRWPPPPTWLGPVREIRKPGKQSDSVRMTITRALAWLADPAVAEAATPGLGEGFDVTEFAAGRNTLYMIGTGRQDAPIAPLFRAFAEYVHDGAAFAGSLTEHRKLDPPLLLALDEVTQICPVPLPQWMADSAGKGIQIIAICHGLAQLEGRWDTHGAQAIWDTAGLKVILGGVTDAGTLEELSRLCGEIDLRTPSRTIDDYGRRARTWTYQPVRILPPELLRTLPDWRALVVRGNLSPVIVRLRMAWRRHDYHRARRSARSAAAALAAAGPYRPFSPRPADLDGLIGLPAGDDPWRRDPADAPPFSPEEVRSDGADWPHLPAGWPGAEHTRRLSAHDQDSDDKPRRPWQRPGDNGDRR